MRTVITSALILFASLLWVGSSPAGATEIYYRTGWSQPHVHYEGASGWTAAPGKPMQSVGNGWWRYDTQSPAKQLLFNDGGRNWDHAPGRVPNYQNPGLKGRVFVEGGRLRFAAGATGRVEEHSFRSSLLGETRRLSVYLPAGYDALPGTRYKVIYLQDGQNLFDPRAFFGGWAADDAADQTAAAGLAEPVIIVGVHNTGARMSEYTPTRDATYGGGEAADYLDFLALELKPAIDRSFRTRPEAENTAIGGSSLGGLL
ncbi:MAG: alpha/beta hydrolase-fold protein, partial [Planctomycetota bacterium]